MDIYAVASLVAFGALCLSWLVIPEPAPTVVAEVQRPATAAA